MQIKTPAGAQPIRAPAQGDIGTHLQASQMAHAAATRSAVARVLAKSGNAQKTSMSSLDKPPSPDSFKNLVIAGAAAKGFKATVPDVHAAIDRAAASGAFHPEQADALKAHDGPLTGTPGAHTIATLTSTLTSMKGPRNARTG